MSEGCRLHRRIERLADAARVADRETRQQQRAVARQTFAHRDQARAKRRRRDEGRRCATDAHGVLLGEGKERDLVAGLPREQPSPHAPGLTELRRR
ncbi:MAG: hypothetical protein ACTHMQ_06890 [Protaetiibacter sp.]